MHRSNFEQSGFVHTPEPAALAALAGSSASPSSTTWAAGCWRTSPVGLTGEPRVEEAVKAGATLVIFSGDKLLGGPQAGCLVGTADAIGQCRTNPFARALRADKLTLAGLQATLELYRDPAAAVREMPVLRMLTRSADGSRRTRTEIARTIPAAFDRPPPRRLRGRRGGISRRAFAPRSFRWSRAAGARGLALRLRLGDPPVMARIEADRVLLDPRTLAPADFAMIARALSTILEG